jgi:hypothetical protein
MGRHCAGEVRTCRENGHDVGHRLIDGGPPRRTGKDVVRAGPEKLIGRPAGEHVLQYAAMIGVRKPFQLSGGPAVQLRAAGRRTDELTVDLPGRVVVRRTEDPITMPLPLVQQDLEQDRPS